MGTHPIFESDFDCLTENCWADWLEIEIENMRELIASIFSLFSLMIIIPTIFFQNLIKPKKGMEISWEMVKLIFNMKKAHFLAKNVTNLQIPDSLKVIDLKTKKELSLRSICESSKVPVVLNFGSCSWPPFMNSLVKFNEMSEKFKNVAKMYIVYISEAHPVDEWYIKTNLKPVQQHKSLEDRLSAAKYFSEETEKITQTPILVDNMENMCETFFAAHPERLIIMKGSKVYFQGGEGPFSYSIPKAEESLEKLLKME